MIADSDRAYISGLFDADGSVSYKKYLCADKRYKDKKGKPKRYWQWKIALEISMTDKSVIRWVHEVLNVGTVNKKPPTGKSLGKKMQYRWRCNHREAYYVCCLIWPWSHVKLPKIQKIIEHYDPGTCGTYGKPKTKGKVINLADFKKKIRYEME